MRSVQSSAAEQSAFDTWRLFNASLPADLCLQPLSRQRLTSGLTCWDVTVAVVWRANGVPKLHDTGISRTAGAAGKKKTIYLQQEHQRGNEWNRIGWCITGWAGRRGAALPSVVIFTTILNVLLASSTWPIWRKVRNPRVVVSLLSTAQPCWLAESSLKLLSVINFYLNTALISNILAE